MKYLSTCKSSRLPEVGALFLFFGLCVGQACGPDFPNRYFDLPTSALLAAPEGFFAVEIERLAPAPKLVPRGRNLPEDTREIDELREALLKRGDPAAHADKVVKAYQNYRAPQRQSAEDHTAAKRWELPPDLPAEFAHYLNGATAWHENDLATARTEWRAVLALPDADRHYRSTWAAYMLGRSADDEFPPEEAQKWFMETRNLVKRGFADSINLAGASYGMEAHWAMALQDYGRAMDLYLEQYATGDESAYASLRIAAGAAATADERQKAALACDPRARRVLTAWFLARFVSGYESDADPRPLRAWTAALVKEQIHDVEQADRLAWLAYQAGDFDLAKRWAGLALDTSAETHWIRAKLALHDNRLGEGAKELAFAAASPQLAPIYRSTLLGELGRVQLALDHREAALTAWLDGAHWEDAAYVAERLLTIDELKIFKTNYCPARLRSYEPETGEAVTPETLSLAQTTQPDPRATNAESLPTALSELLARRLVRAGRLAEAKRYFCAKNQEILMAYATDVQSGFNLMLRSKKRAEAFWRAAQLVREEGMALMGAELEPDFGIWDGSFSCCGAVEERLKSAPDLFAVTGEEKERLATIPIPTKRFSYRYRAAELAWWAASLLPNDDDQTAAILNTAGGWLKNRDPLEANRFYQAMVIRCGHTKLGKLAAERHWFPPES